MIAKSFTGLSVEAQLAEAGADAAGLAAELADQVVHCRPREEAGPEVGVVLRTPRGVRLGVLPPEGFQVVGFFLAGRRFVRGR